MSMRNCSLVEYIPPDGTVVSALLPKSQLLSSYHRQHAAYHRLLKSGQIGTGTPYMTHVFVTRLEISRSEGSAGLILQINHHGSSRTVNRFPNHAASPSRCSDHAKVSPGICLSDLGFLFRSIGRQLLITINADAANDGSSCTGFLRTEG